MGRPLRCATFLAALLAIACRSAGDPASSPDPARRAAAVSRLASSRDEADLPALLVAQDDPSALVRKAAAGTFAARGGPASVEALGKLVADPDPEVASAAARALSALPSERRARDLLVAAYPGAAPAARVEIAAALKAIGGSLREAIELEAGLTWERNVRALERGTPAERAGAAEELGRSGRTSAVRLLAPLLEPERREDPRVVAAAARGLGAAGDRASRPALESLLEEAPGADLAEAAAEALGRRGDPAAADALAIAGAGGPARLGASALDALSALPRAPEVASALCHLAVRAQEPQLAARAAAQARVQEGECAERPFVSRLSRRGSDAAAALAALSELRLTPEIEKARLDQHLASADATIRIAAARALGRLGLAKSVPALSRRAGDAAQRLARARSAGASEAEHEAAEEVAEVLVALTRLRADGAGALAAARLGDASSILRAAAVEALGTRGRDEVGRIGPCLSDPAARVWTAAAEALGRIGPPAVPALAHAAAEIRSDDAERAAALARALGETGSPEAVAALGALSRGPAPAAAAAALGRIGTRDAKTALLEMLARPRVEGRAEAIEALGALEVAEAAPEIARELTSDRPDVRATAARALGRLRQDSGGWLESLRSDYDAQVRRAATEALSRLPSARIAR